MVMFTLRIKHLCTHIQRVDTQATDLSNLVVGCLHELHRLLLPSLGQAEGGHALTRLVTIRAIVLHRAVQGCLTGSLGIVLEAEVREVELREGTEGGAQLSPDCNLIPALRKHPRITTITHRTITAQVSSAGRVHVMTTTIGTI